jgi:hypothetical protein
MEERYNILFKKAGLSWSNYISSAASRLNSTYYLWIFMCGLETFLKANNNLIMKDKKNLTKSLYKDAEDRIYRIIGDSKKIKDYIDSLN